MRASLVVPEDGDAVSSVLAGETEHLWEPPRPNVFQTNQADPRYRVAVVKLRTERGRQVTLHHRGVDPEVDQQTPFDRAVHIGKPHGTILP